MELIKRPIHYTQEGKSIFDQFYLDEDYNVPDQKDDVSRIIQGSAECRTEDIRPVENYVKVTGKIYFRILYMTASGVPKPAVLEGSLPFEEMVYAESDGNETYFIRGVRTEFKEVKPEGNGGDGNRERASARRGADRGCGERDTCLP